MITAMIIVQCLILLIMFATYGKIVEKKSVNPINTTENISKRDAEIFKSGVQQSWTYVNVSLYKMYRELDILDFDNIQNKLERTIEELVQSPEKMEKWVEKLNEYVKSQGSE